MMKKQLTNKVSLNLLYNSDCKNMKYFYFKLIQVFVDYIH